jgi:hypothetical protein
MMQEVADFVGDPGMIRTCDLQLRRASGNPIGSKEFETFSQRKMGLLAAKLTFSRWGREALERRYDRYGWVGIFLIVLGTISQVVANLV